MRSLTVVGAGAIGGTIAAHLVRAGFPVRVVDADREHVMAIREEGLRVEAADGNWRVEMAADTPESFDGDLHQVFLAVKAPHTRTAMEWLAPRLASDGWVMSIQNGLNEKEIAQVIGDARTVGCFINFFADVLEPGLIHYGGPGAFVIGELDGRTSDRLKMIEGWLTPFIPPVVTPNIWGYLWSKMAYGAVLFATATTDETMADCVDHPRYRPMLRRLGAEVVGLAQLQGVQVMPFDGWDPNVLQDVKASDAMFDRVSRMMRANTKVHSGVWRDLAVRHRKTEVDAQYGPVLEVAEQNGYAMPMLRTLVNLIHDLESQRITRGLQNLEILLEAGS